MKKLLLLINGDLGLRVLEYVLQDKDSKLVAIVLNGNEKIAAEYRSNVELQLSKRGSKAKIFQHEQTIWESSAFKASLRDCDYGVSVLFGHLIPIATIRHFDGNLFNLHPSLLPTGRGADPIPWGIIDALPHGVSIHMVDQGLDTGKVVSQMELKTSPENTAGEIYSLAMDELFKIFAEFFSSGKTRKVGVKCVPTLRNRKELESLRKSLFDNSLDYEKMIRVIQAFTYNNGNQLKLKYQDGSIWNVSVHLEKQKEPE